MPTPHHPSAAVRRILRKLGADIRDARLRRNLPAGVIATRAFTSRPTLQRVEEGDPAVGIGIYAAVLNALGLLEAFGNIADIAQDSVGRTLSSADLPKRVYIAKLQKKKNDNA